jgi:phosphogluconate dehydratase
MNPAIKEVTQNIINRSKPYREIYLSRMKEAKTHTINLTCSNIAHAMAPMDTNEKQSIQNKNINIGIITAYNDMLSAHEPYKYYPSLIKKTLSNYNATAQVASGVPAMCDGVTQSQPGMELSLFSRDTIAMASNVGMSHNIFDGAIYLGVCDKIVPGLLMSALTFGYLPSLFIPTGPMPSGISNSEKSKIRQEYAQGKVDESELLKAESASYHSCGTCTFYGTANSNQMLLEMLGLQLPNSSFINANTPLRDKLTGFATELLFNECKTKQRALYEIINEKSFVNAIIGLMATGGSTNHTIHLIAMAKIAGIILKWEDFDAISKVTPLLCKLYPNGSADVNHFRDAGGMAVIIKQLLDLGLIHNDVKTIMGDGLDAFIVEPSLQEDKVIFEKSNGISKDPSILSSAKEPFSFEGGVKLLKGNLGEAVTKISALKKEHLFIQAPAIVFNSQEELQTAFKEKRIYQDFIAVVRYQGPKANGMPELHGLLPALGSLQDMGYKVALITDGRMSGASGKVPSAIHLTPEAKDGGLISKIEDGDIITLDINNGTLNIETTLSDLEEREEKNINLINNTYGSGRELFSPMRKNVSGANEGATIFNLPGEEI